MTVASTPPGAEILIDGVQTNVQTPGTVEVLSGEHELTIQLAGHEPVRDGSPSLRASPWRSMPSPCAAPTPAYAWRPAPRASESC